MEERIRGLIVRIDEELAAGGVRWAGPATPDAIALVESTLGVRFPMSFRMFLSQTGGGGVKGLPISSIGDVGPPRVQHGTVYGDTLYYRESWVSRPLPPQLVVVQRCANDNEPFCLDTSTWAGEECPVVLYNYRSGHVEQIAPNFLAFYERYLAPYFEAAAP